MLNDTEDVLESHRGGKRDKSSKNKENSQSMSNSLADDQFDDKPRKSKVARKNADPSDDHEDRANGSEDEAQHAPSLAKKRGLGVGNGAAKEKVAKRSKVDDDDGDFEDDGASVSDDADVDVDDAGEKEQDFEAGGIIKVEVENFMCHRHMTVEFGKHVTFVTGQNGSGKSAIAVALQLCLGARTSDTGRGKSLATLIREGSDGPAVLKVVLRNTGVDAYRPEEYGQRIIIERKIPKTGGGGYRIFGASRSGASKLVSTKKDELDRILQQFSIHVDNPCIILTQEDSKKFIQGHEKDKYTFFLKATGLQRVHTQLVDSKEVINVTEAELKKVEKALGDKAKALKDAKTELDEMRSFDELDQKAQEALAKIFWVKVEDERLLLSQLDEKIEDTKAEVEKAQEEVALSQSNLESSGTQEEMERKVEMLVAEKAKLEEDFAEKLRTETEKQQLVGRITNNLKLLATNKGQNASRLTQCQRELRELRKKMAEETTDKTQDLRGKLERVMQDTEEMQHRVEVLSEERQKVHARIKEITRSETDFNTRETEYMNVVRTRENNLQQAISAGNAGNPLARFHPKMPEIVAAIQRVKFRFPVVGPLGNEVQWKQGADSRKWVRAIEKTIGEGNFRAFVCGCMEDQRKLQSEVFNRFLNDNESFRIIVQDNTPRHEVQHRNDILTVSDLLQINNDTAFNVFVDQCNIANIMLIENESKAALEPFLRRDGGPLNFDQGLARNGIFHALTPEGTTIRYNNGNQSSEMYRQYPKNYLSSDNAERIANLREQLEIAKRDLAQFHEENWRGGNDRSLHEAKQEEGRLEKEMKNLTMNLKKLAAAKESIESDIADIEGAPPIDTSDLEEEERLLREAIADVERQEEVQQDALTEAKESHKLASNAKKELEHRRESLTKAQREESKRLDKFINTLQALRGTLEYNQKTLARLESKLEVAMQGRDNVLAKINEAVDRAMAGTRDLIRDWDGEPLKVKRNDTEASLTQTCQTIQKQVAAARQKAGLEGRTIQGALAKYEKLRLDLNESKEEYEAVFQNLQKLHSDYKKRKKAWKVALIESQRTTRKYFTFYMKKKGYGGEIEFNDEDRTLKLIAMTDVKDETSQAQDVRNLSGGERSYTTLSLLMSLGHAIDCPFRLMDEYDVFLDEVTRSRTLTLLQNYALHPEQKKKQFIIITPHNLIGVDTLKDPGKVKIVKMHPPKRISAHGLQQQTLQFRGRAADNEDEDV